ncbi:MAG: hypothetical protein HY308_04860 [Gammaproteobacteria bacterium]|nr:hypothetical protein [Gammaproteobacteria bacterium]
MKQQNISSIATRMNVAATQAEVWRKVGFYEHVKKKPSWLLQLSLPTPQEVDGRHDKVGDTCRCRYSDGGYLTKKITHIIERSRIEFEIIEQSIRYWNNVKLLGGYIEVEGRGESDSVVHMVTYYENRIRPNWISSFLINWVIKTMHKFVIRDLQWQLQNNLVLAGVSAD